MTRRSLKVGAEATCAPIIGGCGRDDATGTTAEAGSGRVGRIAGWEAHAHSGVVVQNVSVVS